MCSAGRASRTCYECNLLLIFYYVFMILRKKKTARQHVSRSAWSKPVIKRSMNDARLPAFSVTANLIKCTHSHLNTVEIDHCYTSVEFAK